MDTNILLESGTNELEILEFVVDGHNYGINVAKIREIISYTDVYKRQEKKYMGNEEERKQL